MILKGVQQGYILLPLLFNVYKEIRESIFLNTYIHFKANVEEIQLFYMTHKSGEDSIHQWEKLRTIKMLLTAYNIVGKYVTVGPDCFILLFLIYGQVICHFGTFLGNK